MDSELSDVAKENSSARIQLDPKYNGIGGWLVLVLIGLIITPIRLLVLIITDLIPIFINGTLQVLITPGTEMYSPFWIPLLIFEIFGNAFFVVFVVIILINFFKHKRVLPKLMVIYFISNFMLVLIDQFLSSLIPYVAAQNNAGSYTELTRSIVACSIWVPYFYRSKRVKATFIN